MMKFSLVVSAAREEEDNLAPNDDKTVVHLQKAKLFSQLFHPLLLLLLLLVLLLLLQPDELPAKQIFELSFEDDPFFGASAPCAPCKRTCPRAPS